MDKNAIIKQRATSNEQRIILSSKEKEEEISQLNRKLQLVELDILKTFQSICKKHNLRYFAIGGTCIGAIRHHGFIPWDDDIDVAMPYEDYKKFFEIAKSELPEKYSVIHPEGSILRIQNDNTAQISRLHKTGILIDVVPIYGLPKSKFLQQYLSIKCHFLNRLNEKFSYPNEKRGWKGKILQPYINFLVNSHKPYDYFGAKRDKLFEKYPFYQNQSDKIIFVWRLRPNKKRYTYKQIFFAEDFKSTIDVPFEDTTISVPAGYDRYLKMDFGDYMQLPPEKERTPRHLLNTTIIDFEKSYKEYQDEDYKNPENK